MNREITEKEKSEKSECNGHIRMKAQRNEPQRYTKLREELQVTETNKRGEKFDLGRCRGAASKCVQCLVAHVPPFS